VCTGFHIHIDAGDMYTWGNGEHGELGDGAIGVRPTPRFVAAMKELCQDVQCGDGFTVALSG